MIRSLLLCADGSAFTDSVVKHGINLARSLDASVILLSVVDVRFFEWAMSQGTDGFVPVIPSTVYQEESRKILNEKAEAVIEKSSDLLKDAGVRFESCVLTGSPIDIITEESRLADLLIMGTRGEFVRWKSKMVGATLEAVTHQVNKPILIVPAEFRPLKTLAVGYDGSPNSNRALQLAGYLGSQLSVGVRVVTVSDNEDRSAAVARESMRYLSAYDVEPRTDQRRGHADKELVDVCNSGEVDVMIMGAYGRSRIREAILGSTTEYVMRNSEIPILLAR